MFLDLVSTCGVGGVDMNCPRDPPTGSGIQVQLPSSLYKASHVSRVNFRLQLMVNLFTTLEKTYIKWLFLTVKEHTTSLDVHQKFSILSYKLKPEVSDFFHNFEISSRNFKFKIIF